MASFSSDVEPVQLVPLARQKKQNNNSFLKLGESTHLNPGGKLPIENLSALPAATPANRRTIQAPCTKAGNRKYIVGTVSIGVSGGALDHGGGRRG